MLNKQDVLIIDNKEVTTTTEEHCLEMSWGLQIVKYSISINVEKGSKADKELETYIKNQDKYKLEINIKKI